MDDRITSKHTEGFYVNYMFKEDMTGVYLALRQGISELKKEQGQASIKTLNDNSDKFSLSDLDEDRDAEIKELQDRYNSLIDRIEIKKKPKYSEEELEGIHEGLEESKALFGEFIKGFV